MIRFKELYFFSRIFAFFIGVYMLYNIMLVSTVQQSGSATHIHTSFLPWIVFLLRSLQSTESSSS